MIKIEITDPHNEDPKALRALSAMLSTLAGDTVMQVGGLTVQGDIVLTTPPKRTELIKPTPPITPEDNPSAGAPGAEVFGIAPKPHATLPFSPPGAPPPAPPSAALGATAAAPPPPGALAQAVELDADGLPWDARIHSSSKAINQGDKKWKAKRGVDGLTAANVTSELRQAAAANQAAQAYAGAVAGPVAQMPPPPASAFPNVPSGMILSPHPSPETMPGTVDSNVITFSMLLPRVTAAQAADRLTLEELAQLLRQYGISSLPALATAPAVVPLVSAALDALLASRP